MAAYVMLHGKPFFIEEIHSVESRLFRVCYRSLNGLIPLKVKSRYLEKALEFCKKRAIFRSKYTSPFMDVFDNDFLEDVRNSDLNLIDLIHAAGRLQIQNLFDLLFDDVVCILCLMTPEQVEKIFKVRYNGDAQCYFFINRLLNNCPPCPTLSKEEQEEVKLHREEILKVSPADFKTLPGPRKRYWVYAHLVIKRNPAIFIVTKQISEEDLAEHYEQESKQEAEEDEHEEESKVPKIDDDDVGGPGPRGVAW